MEPIDTPDPDLLDEALKTEVHRPPTREGEEFPLQLNSSVRIDRTARPPVVPTMQAKLVGRWLLDEHGNRFLGWVYIGPVSLEPYDGEKLDGESLDAWIDRALKASCLRVRITDRDGDNAVIEADLRTATGQC
ncbi:hypothetical protein WMF27_31320 [Sorangium sp. So ce281]|uniref:hypothetical protein n=2 Tax=Sorangium TaxID=39643 RepID=UPI003F62AAEF